MKFPSKRVLAGVMAASLVLAACGGDDDDAAETTAAPVEEPAAEPTADEPTADEEPAAEPAADEEPVEEEPAEELSGNVFIDGSSTVAPVTEVAAELFQNATSGVSVVVAVSGTSGGFQKFCSGETDGNDASRPIKDEEIEQCAEAGISYESITVANDALAALVNIDNPIDCMTVDQLNQIWQFDSTVSTWGDVEGLDIPDDFASQDIRLFGPGTDSGTFDYWTEAINGEEGNIRVDYTDIGEDDFAAVTAVEGDVQAMGYVPYSFFQEAGDTVKPLQIDGGGGCVDATLENVQNSSYTPLGRPLFLYASHTALARPEVVAFFEFYINNSEEITSAAGFIPLTDEQKSEQLDKVAALAAG